MISHMKSISIINKFSIPSSAIIGLFVLSFWYTASVDYVHSQSLKEIINDISSTPDRKTGGVGYNRASDYIESHLRKIGLQPEIQYYPLPVRTAGESVLEVNGKKVSLTPFMYNAVTPQSIEKEVSGPVYYVGTGSLEELENKPIAGSIILMDFISGKNWLEAASLGAKALIFINDRASSKFHFEEKTELTPLQFPLFWMQKDDAETIFGSLKNDDTPLAARCSITSAIQWQEKYAKNIYAIIEGEDPQLKEELLVIDAFYDGSAHLSGSAPAADEAASIATFLRVAETLQLKKPGRSVLLAATSGHAQTLAGYRELIWALSSPSKILNKKKKKLKTNITEAEKNLTTLSQVQFPLQKDEQRDTILSRALENQIKSEVDRLSRQLIQIRLNSADDDNKETIQSLVKKRFLLRRLGWTERFDTLSANELKLLKRIIPQSITANNNIILDSKNRLDALSSSMKLRDSVAQYSTSAFISLHLSSHGNGVGGFHEGWLYQLKPNINRTGIYSDLGSLFRKISHDGKYKAPYIDTLRNDNLRSWDTWFLGKPYHGGEVSSLAGYLGITLATVGDARDKWGTPWDTFDNINWKKLEHQTELVTSLLHGASWAESLASKRLPKKGLANVTGRANLLLQGELFADFPAGKALIMSYQGNARFYSMVDSSGIFEIHGVANRKNVVDKVIIEGYRFDDTSGKVIWAVDKKETGKNNYRLKIRRQEMKTDLIFFSCTETTLFGLLEPRNLNYLTKINLLDGRRDAPPQHYWYSRIDTRSSTIASIYTEPGTWLKTTLSDTVLTRKVILTNSNDKNPAGFGYSVDTYSAITNTQYHAAKDLWALLTPRISNLEEHGIVDSHINGLKKLGLEALDRSNTALERLNYREFKSAALQALALANRVYVQVEKTQKDVLFGVLFYIALFVPFAFCAERFLFNYSNIYKRIVAFLLLLVGLITVIYNVHPAFQLAYSPMVVILAFFIIGLSFMVSLIIFFRFEEEMVLLQRRTSHMRPSEISQWKAFLAAFFLGVSNLRRRRLRTILTCLTLIILTFTIMSFTTVKSNQDTNQLLFQENSPYTGILLKKTNWKSLPREAESILHNELASKRAVATRVWMQGKNVTQPIPIPLSHNGKTTELSGIIGLSSSEQQITSIHQSLLFGRWFVPGELHSIILSDFAATSLDLDHTDIGNPISLWGMRYILTGIFDGERLNMLTDLDGEPLTPVIFPQEASSELSEAEQEAMESGDDVRTMQSRYQHIHANQVAIIPSESLYALGGELKSVALLPDANANISTIASRLVERFSLPLFVGGENGVFYYSPSNTLSYKGVPNILVPILLSILIVLNTMVSSVYERKNEIGVYTSVGLAPSHVSFLFIAEAMALAVLSVVLGYLLAQVSAAVLSTTPLWKGITVNYSSMAGVGAMLLVIGVVLVSVIYPSRVAAKIAIPDINKTFTLPQHKDDTIEVMLPFFMKHDEQQSIGGFVFSYFSGHKDISHGLFSTGPVTIVFSCTTVTEIQQMILGADDPSSLNCLHLRAKVWLAPFDFGIMQMVDIQFCPARDNINYLEIKITLERNSGELSMWQRVNTQFLHDIRKQLLIWRSIDGEGHDFYKKILKKELSKNQQNTSTGDALEHG